LTSIDVVHADKFKSIRLLAGENSYAPAA